MHPVEHKGADAEYSSKIVFKGSLSKYWILEVIYREGLSQKLMDIKSVFWNKSHKAHFVFRHVNTKIKVEALLDEGIMFPEEYYDVSQIIP